MKLSVSLPDRDVAFLDRYVAEQEVASRSAALQEAVNLLRLQGLIAEYEQAYEEWEVSGEAAIWNQASGDGIGDDE